MLIKTALALRARLMSHFLMTSSFSVFVSNFQFSLLALRTYVHEAYQFIAMKPILKYLDYYKVPYHISFGQSMPVQYTRKCVCTYMYIVQVSHDWTCKLLFNNRELSALNPPLQTTFIYIYVHLIFSNIAYNPNLPSLLVYISPPAPLIYPAA